MFDNLLAISISIFAIAAHVSSKGPPVITNLNYHKDLRLPSGKLLKLICPVQNDPLLLIKWAKDGRDIYEGSDRYFVKQNYLHVKDIDVSDSGDYDCTATNGFGSITLKFTVCVLGNDSAIIDSSDENGSHCAILLEKSEAPRLLDRVSGAVKQLDVHAGGKLTLTCLATGRPRPDIHWTHNDRPFVSHHETNFTLTFRHVTAENAGRYTCKVSNRAGSSNYTYDVIVKDVIEDDTRHYLPYILENVTAALGSTAEFICRVRSKDEETTLRWLRQVNVPHGDVRNTTISLDGDQHFSVLQIHSASQSYAEGEFRSTLTIQSVTERDAGVYVCLSTGLHGFENASAILTINYDADRMKEEEEARRRESGALIPQRLIPVAIAVGSVILVIVIALVLYVCRRRCRNRSSSKRSAALSSDSPATSSPLNSASALRGSSGGGSSSALDSKNPQSVVTRAVHGQQGRGPTIPEQQPFVGYYGTAPASAAFWHNGQSPSVHKPLLQQQQLQQQQQSMDFSNGRLLPAAPTYTQPPQQYQQQLYQQQLAFQQQQQLQQQLQLQQQHPLQLSDDVHFRYYDQC